MAPVALVGFSATQLIRSTPSTLPAGQRQDRVGLIVAALILASLATILLGIQVGGRSPWSVYKLFPGGAGVRSVSRYVLTLSLPLAVGLAYALDRLLARPRSIFTSAAVAAAVLAVGCEQLAMIKLFSADTAERFQTSVADMVDHHCSAFYLKQIDSSSVTEQTFDTNAYLAANQDVAKNWKGSALEHFMRHGKDENRSLSPVEPHLNDYYQLTASLAALAAGVPTVNGVSSKPPPGWDLMGVFGPNIGEHVNTWLLRNGYGGQVCLIAHDLDSHEIPVRMPSGLFR
jgi:phage tail protein X